jgi:hypothetical protein
MVKAETRRPERTTTAVLGVGFYKRPVEPV